MLLALQIQCNLRAAPLPNYGGVEKKSSKKAKTGKRDKDENYRPIMANLSEYEKSKQLEMLRANYLKSLDKDGELQEQSNKLIDNQIALILMMTIH